MTQQYKCDYCKKVFEEYSECYQCENSHVTRFDDWGIEPELRSRYQYKPGSKYPDKILLQDSHWDYKTDEQIINFVCYKFVGEVSTEERDKILAEQKARLEEAERKREEDRARREAEEAAKAAAEEQVSA